MIAHVHPYTKKNNHNIKDTYIKKTNEIPKIYSVRESRMKSCGFLTHENTYHTPLLQAQVRRSPHSFRSRKNHPGLLPRCQATVHIYNLVSLPLLGRQIKRHPARHSALMCRCSMLDGVCLSVLLCISQSSTIL